MPRVEVIENDNAVTCIDELAAGVRANVASSAGDEDGYGHIGVYAEVVLIKVVMNADIVFAHVLPKASRLWRPKQQVTGCSTLGTSAG